MGTVIVTHPDCGRARRIGWPAAWEPSRGRWPAPLAATQFTAFIAAGNRTELEHLWASLSLISQVNLFAALACQARCSASQAQQLGFRSSLDPGELRGKVCAETVATVTAALAGSDEWEIPACPQCIRTASEAMAELHITNWQAVIPVTREVIAHELRARYRQHR